MRMIWILIVGGAIGLVLWMVGQSEAVSLDDDRTMRLVYMSVLLAYMVFAFGSLGGGDWRRLARAAGLWALIIAGLALGWTYRESLRTVAHDVRGEFLPSSPQSMGAATVLRRDFSGHFNAKGAINGEPVEFLVDTGASRLTIPYEVAGRIGIDVGRLDFDIEVMTANGEARAAATVLRTVSVGDVFVEDVNAFVTQPGALDGALLGMSFLNRLESYEFSGSRLTLRPRKAF